MRYPHDKYLRFLITKGLTNQEVQEDCKRLNLVIPKETEIDDLRISIGRFPSGWSKNYRRGSHYFNKWLTKKGLRGLWSNSKDVSHAINFLYKTKMRENFNTLVIATGDIDSAITDLALKYGDMVIPSREILLLYYEIFWDIGSLSRSDLMEFIGKYHDKETAIAAIEGDKDVAYARSGLTQTVTQKEFTANLLAFANLQVQLSRKEGTLLAGTQMMGIAALSRQALDALRLSKEGNEVEGSEAVQRMRDDAMMFQLAESDENSIIDITELEEKENGPRLIIDNEG